MPQFFFEPRRFRRGGGRRSFEPRTHFGCSRERGAGAVEVGIPRLELAVLRDDYELGGVFFGAGSQLLCGGICPFGMCGGCRQLLTGGGEVAVQFLQAGPFGDVGIGCSL